MSKDLVIGDIGIQNLSISLFDINQKIGQIKKEAFQNACQSQEYNLSISIPAADYIEDDTFKGCYKLQSLILPGINYTSKSIFGTDSDKLALTSLNNIEIKNCYSSSGALTPAYLGTCFSNLPYLSSISFPSSLQTFQKINLSGCQSLKSLILDKNVLVDENAFSELPKLENIITPLPTSVNSLGLNSLSELTSISILKYQPESYYTINSSVFNNQNSLIDILFENYGENLTYIDANAFENVQYLNDLNLSNSLVSQINSNTFKNCKKLKYIIVKTDTLSCIKQNGFNKCNEISILESIGNPNATNSIRHMYPHGASKLIIQSFGNNTLTAAEPSAFMNTQIEGNKLTATNIYSYGNYSFSNISQLSSVKINSQIESSIPSYCFANDYSLSDITIGNKITEIQSYAFNSSNLNVIRLESLYHPGLVLADNALIDLIELKEIPFNKIKSVGKNALKNCYSIQYDSNSLVNITSIKSNAFENSIIYVDDAAIPIELNKNLFENIEQDAFKNCKIKAFHTTATLNEFNEALSSKIGSSLIPEPLYDTGKNKIIWEKIKTFFGISFDGFEMQLNDFIFNKDGGKNNFKCFKYDDAGTTITGVRDTEDIEDFKKNPIIPSKAIAIADNAFNIDGDKFKTNLTALQTNNVTSFGAQCLENTTSLLNFNGNKIQTIGNKALKGCVNLTSCLIPKLTSIGQECFADCSSLKIISSYNIESIGLSAFCNMNSLLTVDLGSLNNGSLTIPSYCFVNDTKLNTIILPARLQSMQNNSLKNVGSTTDGISNLSVYIKQKTKEQASMIIPSNNAINSPIGTRFFTEDFSYHSFITTATNKIYSVSKSAFLIEIKKSKITLTKIDNAKLPSYGNKLTVEDLTGLFIAADAAKGCSNLHSLYLDNALTSNIEVNAFANANNLKVIYISINYSEPNKAKYLGWTNSNTNTTYQFNNGSLSYNGVDWVFSSDSDPFIDDIYIPGRIVRVNDAKVEDSGIQRILSSHTSIGNGSLSSTNKINTLIIENNISCIENSAFKGNYSIDSIDTTNAINLEIIQESAFVDSCIKTIEIPYNDKRRILNGYGLNNTGFLEYLSYKKGDNTVEVAPSAMINCRSMLSSLQLPTNTTTIGKYAFAEMKSFFPAIRDINIDSLNSLTCIDDYAFYNSLVTTEDNIAGKKLIIPKKVKIIGTAAFGYDSDATIQSLSGIEFTYNDSIDIGYNLQSIGPSAFIRNHFKEVKFYDGTRKTYLTSIGDYAFAYPKNKYSMHIPTSIKQIGVGAFKKNIILNPDSVEKNIIKIELSSAKDILKVFLDPTSPTDDKTAYGSLNSNYEANNSVSASDHTVFLASKGNLYTSYIYVNNNKLNVCPDNLSIDIVSRKVIGAALSTTYAYIPKYIYTIGAGAFQNCVDLTSISSANDSLIIEASAFYNCQKLKNINDPAIFRLSSISPYSFYNCKSLSNIQILSNAVSVGTYAFYNCSSITAFQEIDTSEKRNYTLSVIEDYAFQNCTGITSFFIPSNLSYIGRDVFKDCINLSILTIDLLATEFQELVGYRTVSDAVKNKFSNIRDDGKCAIIFNDVVYMNNGTIKIDDEYIDIRYADGKSSISSFNYEKFQNDRMTYLNLSNITEVDPFVFRNAEDLEFINFLPGEQRLMEIGDYAFSKCSYLVSINGNNLSVQNIGNYAFANCHLFYEMTFDGDLLSKIGQGAFYNTSLEKMIFNVDLDSKGKIADDFIKDFKKIINWDEELNHNPLELPENTIIIIKDKSSKNIRGKYDYKLNDLIHADIDINRNSIVYIDKRVNAIKPLVLVKAGKGMLPAIIDNKFHMNVIGRWK